MRRYRFSWKFALVLITGILVCGLGVFGLHRFQIGRNSQALKTASERAEQGGEIDRSIRLLQRYLATHVDDTDAQLRFAGMIERRAGGGPGRFQSIPAYQQVVSNDPSRVEARQRLATLLTEAGRRSDALPHLKVLASADPTNPAAHAAVGRCYAAMADWENAERAYAAASKLPTVDVESVARLAECRWLLQRPEAATKTMDEMVARFPNNARAYLLRAAYRTMHSLPQASDDLATAKRLDPHGADVMLAVAEAATLARKPDEARKELTTGLEQHIKDPRFYLALARLELSENRPTESVALLRRGVKELPSEAELIVELVHQLLDTGDTTTARTTFTSARTNPRVKWSAVEIDLLRGRLAVAANDWPEAVKVFGGLKNRVPENSPQSAMINRLLSRNARRQGDSEHQLDLLQRSIAAAPTREVKMEFAQALAASGRLPDAIRQFRELAEAEPPVAGASVMLARLLLVSNPPSTSADAAWTEIEKLIDREIKVDPKSLAALLTRADILVSRGRRDEAIKLLDAACQDASSGPSPWVARASLEARAGRPDEARRLLDDAGKRHGEPIEVRVARLLLALEYPPSQAVEEIGRVTAALDGMPAAQAAPVWSLAAQAYLRLERFPQAMNATRVLISLTPDDLQSHLIRFQSAIRVNDDSAAAAAVDAIRRVEGTSGGIASYCSAYRLIVRQLPEKVDRTTLNTARGHLAEAAARRPRWPKVPLLRAQVELLEGEAERAAQSYREAFDAGERSFDVVRSLISHYAGKKQYQEAYNLIRRMQDSGSVPLDEQRLFTAVYLQAADYGRALETAKQAVATDSTNPQDHLWLALVYASAKKNTEADAEFVKACELSKTPEAWVARVQFLAATDRRKEAESLTDQLAILLPKERADLTTAACNEALGRREQSDKAYQTALAASPQDPQVLRSVASYLARSGRFSQAEPLLRRLLSPEMKLSTNETSEVRRMLALGISEDGNYARCTEAIELLKLNALQTGKEDRADLLAKAAVFAKRPGGKREAVALYEQLAPAGLSTSARYVLAQLYLLAGDTSKAREQMLLVLGEEGNNLEYLEYWAGALIDLKSYDDAQYWVGRLARVAPGKWSAAKLQARLLKARGQTREALSRISRYSPENEVEAVAAALWLEEFEDTAAADKIWKGVVEGKQPPPNVGFQYAEYLGRRGKTTEALDWCERFKQKIPAPALAAVAVDILGYGGRVEDYRRVDDWLVSVPNMGPDSFPARFYRAMLLDRQGKHAEAVSALMTLVDEQPNNTAVLSEYGKLLALTGASDEAEKVLSRAIQLDGPKPELTESLTIARRKLSPPTEVAGQLANALTLEPSASGYLLLARLQHSGGDKKAAEQSVREARRRNYKPATAHPLEADEVRRVLAAFP